MLMVDRKRTPEGYLVILKCSGYRERSCGWERQADAQQPLWVALVAYADHWAQRHAEDDDAIARAQRKTGYDKGVVTLELPCE